MSPGTVFGAVAALLGGTALGVFWQGLPFDMALLAASVGTAICLAGAYIFARVMG